METNILIDLVLVIISIIMLWKGADWLVDSAAEIAHTLKVSDLIIGLLVELQLFVQLQLLKNYLIEMAYSY